MLSLVIHAEYEGCDIAEKNNNNIIDATFHQTSFYSFLFFYIKMMLGKMIRECDLICPPCFNSPVMSLFSMAGKRQEMLEEQRKMAI